MEVYLSLRRKRGTYCLIVKQHRIAQWGFPVREPVSISANRKIIEELMGDESMYEALNPCRHLDTPLLAAGALINVAVDKIQSKDFTT